MSWIATAIIGSGALVTAGGVYGASQASKAAGAQQEQYNRLTDPQIQYMQAMFPYFQKQMEEYTYPMLGQTYDILSGLGSAEVQPWEKKAVSDPFEAARQALGTRAAGARTLGAGSTQKLASLYDIAEAQSMAQLPYQKRQQAVGPMMQFAGLQPGMTPPAAQQPQAYQPQQINYEALGTMMAMMGQNQGAASIPSTYKYGSAQWSPGAGAGGTW